MRQYYMGTITEITDPVLYQIKVDIPDIIAGVPAFPFRGETDEPRIGDTVLLLSLDQMFGSYYLYQKIKETDFIGFRSNGKMIDVTPDYIQIATFDPEAEYNDLASGGTHRPETLDWIKLDSSGNLEVSLRENATLTITGNTKIEVTGSTEITSPDITVTGSSTVKIDGKTTTITGGTLKTVGTSNTDMMGPFCGIPLCPFSGAPHTGSTVSNT